MENTHTGLRAMALEALFFGQPQGVIKERRVRHAIDKRDSPFNFQASNPGIYLRIPGFLLKAEFLVSGLPLFSGLNFTGATASSLDPRRDAATMVCALFRPAARSLAPLPPILAPCSRD